MSKAPQKTLRRDALVAGACGAFVALMIGAAYASVPFYTWFCKVTGYGGTTQVAKAAAIATRPRRRLCVRDDTRFLTPIPLRERLQSPPGRPRPA